jgi:hypothetical protein
MPANLLKSFGFHLRHLALQFTLEGEMESSNSWDRLPWRAQSIAPLHFRSET